MSTIATIASVVGSVAQIAAQVKAASDARRVANYNAQVSDVNAEAEAQVGEIEAQQALRQAQVREIEAQQYLHQAELARQDQILVQQAQQYREARTREQHARLLATSRAIIASSGLLFEGSPLAVFEDTARQQELDILAQRYQSTLQVRALEEDITQRTYAAAGARWGAEVARYGAEVARWRAGERIRVGRSQAGLLRAQGDEAFAGGLLSAAGSAVKGVSSAASLAQQAQLARQEAPTTVPTITRPWNPTWGES